MLHDQVSAAVAAYVQARLEKVGRAADPGLDLFEAGVLDSVSLVELITAVEQATELELDFIEVDPDELGTATQVVDEFTRVLQLEL